MVIFIEESYATQCYGLKSKAALAGDIYCNPPSFSIAMALPWKGQDELEKHPRGSTSLGFNSSSVWELPGLSL